MQFDSWQDFVAMGGYGFYVWLVYLCALVLLGGLVLHGKLNRKRLEKQMLKQQGSQGVLTRDKDGEV